jgi:hypothetical protein
MPRFFETKLRRHAKLMHGLAKLKSNPFEKKDEFGLINLLKDFRLFRRGHSRHIFNIIPSKSEEKTIHLFDYRYVISGGNSHIPYYQTVLFLQSKNLDLPSFRLIPRKFYHNFLEWIGFKDDIDYIAEPIEDHYRIHTDAKELFTANFSRHVRQFLSMHPDWTVEGMGYYFIAYKNKRLLNLEQIEDLEKYANELFDLIKDKASLDSL